MDLHTLIKVDQLIVYMPRAGYSPAALRISTTVSLFLSCATVRAVFPDMILILRLAPALPNIGNKEQHFCALDNNVTLIFSV